MNPLRLCIGTDIWAIYIQLRQVQNIAVRILACRHDARNHIGCVHIKGNAGQVFPFSDMNIAVSTHALDKEHIMPVTSQFCTILSHYSPFAKQRFNRIDILKNNALCCTGEVGIKRKGMLRHAFR